MKERCKLEIGRCPALDNGLSNRVLFFIKFGYSLDWYLVETSIVAFPMGENLDVLDLKVCSSKLGKLNLWFFNLSSCLLYETEDIWLDKNNTNIGMFPSYMVLTHLSRVNKNLGHSVWGFACWVLSFLVIGLYVIGCSIGACANCNICDKNHSYLFSLPFIRLKLSSLVTLSSNRRYLLSFWIRYLHVTFRCSLLCKSCGFYLVGGALKWYWVLIKELRSYNFRGSVVSWYWIG